MTRPHWFTLAHTRIVGSRVTPSSHVKRTKPSHKTFFDNNIHWLCKRWINTLKNMSFPSLNRITIQYSFLDFPSIQSKSKAWLHLRLPHPLPSKKSWIFYWNGNESVITYRESKRDSKRVSWQEEEDCCWPTMLHGSSSTTHTSTQQEHLLLRNLGLQFQWSRSLLLTIITVWPANDNP